MSGQVLVMASFIQPLIFVFVLTHGKDFPSMHTISSSSQRIDWHISSSVFDFFFVSVDVMSLYFSKYCIISLNYIFSQNPCRQFLRQS